MDTLSDKSQANWFLQGVESGKLSAADSYNFLKDRDPVLVYFLLRYLKEKYGSSHPNARALQERLLEITTTYEDIKKMLRTGEKDPMREWFDDTHSVRDFAQDTEGYVALIVDKLEG